MISKKEKESHRVIYIVHLYAPSSPIAFVAPTLAATAASIVHGTGAAVATPVGTTL